MSSKVLRVGGVPEHFNYPWQIALEQDLLKDHEFSFSWQDYPGGTGAMCRDLNEGKLDIAILLTEGIIADIIRGNPSKIIGTYVQSPLTWGIHVHAQSTFENLSELSEATFAISRYQSGSHLMAVVNAQQQGWNPESVKFELVGNFEGAREALKEKKADAFMWEKFTTKPTVDSGEWRRVGECLTPWPCFVIAARDEVIAQAPENILSLLELIEKTLSYYPEAQTISYISECYGLKPEDTQTWYRQTEWLCKPQIAQETLEKTQQVLQELKIIDQKVPSRGLCNDICRIIETDLSQVMYNWRVDSVRRMLARKGKAFGTLAIEDLTALGHLDQYHYLGEKTCYEVVEALELSPEKYVYDIGSGVGGTSRVIAHASGCKVLGIEVQAELNTLAQELTNRVGLGDLVKYVTGDFLDYNAEDTFDHFISLLVFLHIPKRPEVLKKCYQSLKPGGSFFIEDLITLKPLSAQASDQLQNIVSAPSVSSIGSYQQELSEAGFRQLEVLDMSEAWTAWTAKRYQEFVDNKSFNLDFFGPEIYENRKYFYQTIRDLFAGGEVGGVRIVGRKPA